MGKSRLWKTQTGQSLTACLQPWVPCTWEAQPRLSTGTCSIPQCVDLELPSLSILNGEFWPSVSFFEKFYPMTLLSFECNQFGSRVNSIKLKQRLSIISVLSWVWSWGQGHCYLVTLLPLFFSFPTLSHPSLFCQSLGVLYLSQLHFNPLGAWSLLSLSASFPGFLFLMTHPSLPVFLGICSSSLKSSSLLYHSCLSYKFAQNHHRDNKY